MISTAIPVQLDGETLTVRPMRDEESAEVQRLWLHSYKSHSKVNATVYDSNQPALIARLIAAHGASIVSSGTLDTTILGWACGVPHGPLHYAYVPFELRRNGIARMAIMAALEEYPSRIEVTHKFHGRINSHRFVHNPYPLGMAA